MSNPDLLVIGDSLSTTSGMRFVAIPWFSPERFGRLLLRDISSYKQFHKALEQLEADGVIQVLYERHSVRREPIAAAVGDLQFDVVEARLSAEYGVAVRVERLPHVAARWLDGDPVIVEQVRWALNTIHARP